jgi:predicted N-acetyltransferase YhbS
MATRTALSVAPRHSSPRLASPRKSASPISPVLFAPPPAPGTLRLAPARTGDHPAIHRLLVSVFHGPSPGEFHAQLDEPGYEPADRLVVRDGEEIAAHLRLARQRIQLDGLALPAARFMDLATAPEYRSRGLATALLAAGERAARERGVLVGVTRTRAAALFARQGWSICGRHVFSTAAPRHVLAELGAVEVPAATSVLLQAREEPIVVRPLRRIELPAIVRLYERNLAGRSGWPLRSEEYWDWLLARGACDRIYVAATGPETSDLPKLLASIVGYAFVRQGRLVEVNAEPGRPEVARRLAARVCADASEQGGWEVRCDAPPDDPLHALLRDAGGRLVSQQQLDGEVFMAKLLDPLAVLRECAGALLARARQAGLARPVRLGVELRSGNASGSRGGKANGQSPNGRGVHGRGASGRDTSGLVERYRLHLGRRGARVETGVVCRHAIVLRYGDLAPLVLGDSSAEDLHALGRLRATTRTARRTAAALFPAAPWWRPPLDDLLA